MGGFGGPGFGPRGGGDDGIWTLTVGPLRPDMYAYHLTVDGVQMADPNNTYAAFTAMPPYSQLVVHGDGPAYYDASKVPHGTVTRHAYHSEVTRGERELYVYAPPGYDRTKTYPVLYLVGGSGELPSNWIYDGRANFIMDNLLAEKKAVPMVIAIPNNQVVHRNNPKHTELTFKLFEAELRRHVVPLVEREYSVRRDPKGRALSGLSITFPSLPVTLPTETSRTARFRSWARRPGRSSATPAGSRWRRKMPSWGAIHRASAPARASGNATSDWSLAKATPAMSGPSPWRAARRSR